MTNKLSDETARELLIKLENLLLEVDNANALEFCTFDGEVQGVFIETKEMVMLINKAKAELEGE